MPNHAKPNVILRQWEMLRLIPNCDHPGRSVQDLAAALETRGYRVTRRTVERDLDTLQQCMPLELNDNVRPQRWRWQKARSVDIPGMEAAEAMALFMMQDAMRSHLPSCFVDALQGRFAQANKTLAALARAGANVRWADRVRVVPSHVVLKPPRIATRVVQTLQRAVLNDIPVEAEYQSLQEVRPSSRLLFPRALILRGSSLYLIAHQKNRDESPHHYAVQRFTSVRLRELEAWPNASFSLDQFLADGVDQFGDGREIQLRARISPELHKTLHDSPLSTDMTIVADKEGTLTLTATVRDTWALHTWILGHAESLCVLQPIDLRRALAERLKEAATQYR
jgi:predicted DNA-binding transcriptional regulator YafY